MQKTLLGTSDLNVTKVCLGTMTFGRQNTEMEAHSQLDYAIERGINFIDTAEMYPVAPNAETSGSTERFIGTWLKKSGKRDDIVLATKVTGPATMPWIRDGENNLDAANIRAAINGSLKRLQTDYIDLYQLHWPSRNVPIFGDLYFSPDNERAHVPIEETLTVLADLMKEGKIRHIGVSNESAWGVSQFIKQSEIKGLPRIATIQNCYHLANRVFEQDLDETCFRENVALLAYSPLAFGQLSAKYIDNPEVKARMTIFPPTWSPRYLRPLLLEAVKRYATLARANGLTPAQLALAWCYSRREVAATIIGATSIKQLEENINAYEIRLSDEILTHIDQIHNEVMNPAR